MFGSFKKVIGNASRKVGEVVERVCEFAKDKAALLVGGVGTAIATTSAQAQESTVWSAAESGVSSAATSLVAFIGALIVIPLAIFGWKLVKRLL